MSDETVTKTLWSETLIDVLVVALKKNSTRTYLKIPRSLPCTATAAVATARNLETGSNEKIREILQELQQKGFKLDYIVDKITRELDTVVSRRVRSLAIK